MIGYLHGKILAQEEHTILVEVGGVGYELFVGNPGEMNFGNTDDDVSIWVHTYVREDQITLFGFRESIQKKIFLILIGITGIGPKLALAVVRQMGPGELAEAVTLGNTKLLRAIPGVGPKMADRMVLELKGKLANFVKEQEWAKAGDGAMVVWRELNEALSGLGFSDQKIRNVIKLLRTELSGKTPEINQILKLALQKIKNC